VGGDVINGSDVINGMEWKMERKERNTQVCEGEERFA
jgi:hypothetical protein